MNTCVCPNVSAAVVVMLCNMPLIELWLPELSSCWADLMLVVGLDVILSWVTETLTHWTCALCANLLQAQRSFSNMSCYFSSLMIHLILWFNTFLVRWYHMSCFSSWAWRAQCGWWITSCLRSELYTWVTALPLSFCHMIGEHVWWIETGSINQQKIILCHSCGIIMTFQTSPLNQIDLSSFHTFPFTAGMWKERSISGGMCCVEELFYWIRPLSVPLFVRKRKQS